MFNNSSKGSMEFASKSSTKFIADLTPDNIASMLVMTGTAASTLYGSEIANCTVLITIYYEKRMRPASLRVTVTSNTEFMTLLWLPEFWIPTERGAKIKTPVRPSITGALTTAGSPLQLFSERFYGDRVRLYELVFTIRRFGEEPIIFGNVGT